MEPEFILLDDPDAVADAAVTRFVAAAEAAIAARGRFVVALAGGSTPERLYKRLANRELPWEQMLFFFSDDRYVSLGSPTSNAGTALRLWLNPTEVAPRQIFTLDVETTIDAAEAAQRYEEQVLAVLGDVPRFDLILLGMGEDGHTASLFPGKPALKAKRWVTASTPGVLPPPVERVTFTFKLINAAYAVLFLVTGGAKAPKVAAWQAGEGSVAELPVLGVKPAEGTLTVLLDRAAAGQ